jgi:hypothetical protein
MAMLRQGFALAAHSGIYFPAAATRSTFLPMCFGAASVKNGDGREVVARAGFLTLVAGTGELVRAAESPRSTPRVLVAGSWRRPMRMFSHLIICEVQELQGWYSDLTTLPSAPDAAAAGDTARLVYPAEVLCVYLVKTVKIRT